MLPHAVGDSATRRHSVQLQPLVKITASEMQLSMERYLLTLRCQEQSAAYFTAIVVVSSQLRVPLRLHLRAQGRPRSNAYFIASVPQDERTNPSAVLANDGCLCWVMLATACAAAAAANQARQNEHARWPVGEGRAEDSRLQNDCVRHRQAHRSRTTPRRQSEVRTRRARRELRRAHAVL